MARQDDWVRLQVRLPRALHAKLTEAAEFSMNQEIVDRLEESFREDAYRQIMRPSARIEIDASGSPLSWEEINRAVTQLVQAFPHTITSLTVEVLTPEIRAALQAREDAFNALTGIRGFTRVNDEE